jgi:hypothetical protein
VISEIRTARETRHGWPFAGTKKPGACPGFEMMVVLTRRHETDCDCNAGEPASSSTYARILT